MLELRNIHRTYQVVGVKTVVLDGISVTFRVK